MNKVVVRAPNWLGDAVMAIPAIASVRAQFPQAALTVAALDALVPLFHMVDGVDEVLPLGGGADLVRLPGRTAGDVRALAASGFDLAILLPNSFQSAWAVYRAGIPERWGYRADLRGRVLTRAVRRPAGRRGLKPNQAQYYLDLVSALGMRPAPLEARITPPEAARRQAGAIVGDVGEATPLVGVAPGAAYGHAKRWPPRHFAALIDRVDRELGARAVLVGTAQDRDAGRAIESSVGRACLNLIGRTDLTTLAGLLARCRAFVSNDSGAMHLAAAVGVPVTAIFGPTDERATAPLGPHQIVTHPVWCRPCLLRECPIDHRCMTRITPEDVFTRVAQAFRPAPPPSP